MLRLTALMLTCLTVSCIPFKNRDAETKQETDDRTTTDSAKLVDVAPVLEQLVNEGVASARSDLAITTDDISDEMRRNLLEKVGEKIGAYVKGSGVTPLDIVQLTNLEIRLDEMLSAEKLEKIRVPFRCSRYRDNPIGIPILSGATPANISESTANHTISSAFKFNKTLVGGDKLAHIWAVGRKMYLAGLSQDEIQMMSQFLEGDPDFPKKHLVEYAARGIKIDPAWGVFGVYGTASTGIISQADTNANVSGVRFFENLYKAPATYTFTLASLCEGSAERPCEWYWNEQNVPNRFTRLVKVNDLEGCRW
jgi:hypothetical protein